MFLCMLLLTFPVQENISSEVGLQQLYGPSFLDSSYLSLKSET